MPPEWSCVGINGSKIWRYVCMSEKKNFFGGGVSPRFGVSGCKKLPLCQLEEILSLPSLSVGVNGRLHC